MNISNAYMYKTGNIWKVVTEFESGLIQKKLYQNREDAEEMLKSILFEL